MRAQQTRYVMRTDRTTIWLESCTDLAIPFTVQSATGASSSTALEAPIEVC
jgi:hypothetical protein